MKRAALSIIIFLLAFSARLYAQVTDTSGILWKATLTYFLEMDRIDSNAFKQGYESHSFRASHLKITHEQGTLRNMLNELYNALYQDRESFYNVDIYNHYRLDKRLKHSDVFTVPDEDGNPTPELIKPTPVGFSMNEEWLYNKRNHSLDIQVTDMGLLSKGKYGYEIAGAFKFINRMNDSTRTQLIDNPDIAWAEGLYSIYHCDSMNEARLDNIALGTPDVSYENNYKEASKGFEIQNPYYLKVTYNLGLANWLFNQVVKGQITAYQCVKGDKNNDVGTKISISELKDFTTIMDTMQDEDGDPIAVRAPITISGMMVVKEITFNKKTFRLESKILRVAICREERDNAQRLIGNIPVFWIKFE